jgi:hypothetical protein
MNVHIKAAEFQCVCGASRSMEAKLRWHQKNCELHQFFQATFKEVAVKIKYGLTSCELKKEG